MKIFKKTLAIILLIVAIFGCCSVSIIMYYPHIRRLTPIHIALCILLFRWAADLWITDPETSHIKGWKKSLIYIGVYIGQIIVCSFIGAAVSVYTANGDPDVTNFVFLLSIFILGMWLKPKKFIPKQKQLDSLEE